MSTIKGTPGGAPRVPGADVEAQQDNKPVMTDAEQAVVVRDGESKAEVPHPIEGGIGMCPYHSGVDRGDPAKLREVAAETIRDHVFGDDSFAKAEKSLISALQADPMDKEGKTNHLLGLTYFHMQRWGDAIKHLEVAVQRNPEAKESIKILQRARENAASRVDRPMGTTQPLDGSQLSKPPALYIREPDDLKPTAANKPNPLAVAAEAVVGNISELAVHTATRIAGWFADDTTTYKFESWDEKGDLQGKLELAAIREDLNKDKLVSTYDGQLVAGQAEGQVRPAWTERFRTATGAWTTNNPMEGAAGTEFQRTGAPLATRTNKAEDPSLPNAREVSRVLLTNKGERTEAPFLNNLAIAWIQFQNHDWVSHRPTLDEGHYTIPLAEDDPLRKTYGVENMHVPKTSNNPLKEDGEHTYANEVTHWWDGSQIYGSDQATQDRLRMGPSGDFLEDGKMRIEGDALPMSPSTGVEDTGYSRNWWVGLNLLHTVFVKEHNHICDELKKEHPDWSSDQLFQTARLINAAVMAKIHTVEWTPAVLPNKKLTGAMGANWWGLIETMRKPFEERRTDGFEPPNNVLGGIIGGKTDNHGKPYGLSEEFVEVYRLHAGMLDHVKLQPVGADEPVGEIAAEGTRGAGARDLVAEHGMATLLNSFGNQKMTALVENNYPAFFQDMSMDGQSVVDLGAIDILRARERGVPQYNEFRRSVGLPELEKWEDLGCSEETLKNLKETYGEGKEGLEKMDLLIGTLCEARRPENYGFGETLFQVFIQMASRRLEADPFFTEKFNEETYTKTGMDIIEEVTFKDVLLRHYPDLANTGLAELSNGFEPWSSTPEEAPHEHPLAAGSESYVEDD